MTAHLICLVLPAAMTPRSSRNSPCPGLVTHATFPQYRAREDEISTQQERVNGCLERSIVGKALPPVRQEMKAFIT